MPRWVYDKAMITFRSQKGDASAIAIVVLVLAIVASLGFVAWNNYITAQRDATQPELTPIDKEKYQIDNESTGDTELYFGPTYSFEYPIKGWELSEEVGNSPDETFPRLKTPDWAQSGMGLDAGAEISVYHRTATQSLAELRGELAELDPRADEVPDVEVGGTPAMTYRMNYEGERYYTVVIHEGTQYDIVYNYANGSNAETYLNDYNLVLSTFAFADYE